MIANVICNSAKQGLIPQREYFDKDIANSDNTNGYYIIETNDFVYNPRKSADAPYGPISSYKYPKAGIVSPLYLCFRAKQEINPLYFEWYFRSSAWHRYIYMSGDSGARHDRVSIKDDTFFAMPINIPSTKEQERISLFLDAIERRIETQRTLVETLKKYKRGLLQNMFPRKGEAVPRLRLAGFTGDWERIKFSDFTWNAGMRNKDGLDLEPYAITNEHGFIRQSEAHDDFGYMKNTDRKAYNIVKPNSFGYNPARINVGSIGYYEGTNNIIVSSLYEVFQTADCIDDRFLWHWFKSDEFFMWITRLQEGSVRLYFYYDKLCECEILVPSVSEQKRIAETLDNLDNLIALHQCRLDSLMHCKKGLLQQLFI